MWGDGASGGSIWWTSRPVLRDNADRTRIARGAVPDRSDDVAADEVAEVHAGFDVGGLDVCSMAWRCGLSDSHSST